MKCLNCENDKLLYISSGDTIIDYHCENMPYKPAIGDVRGGKGIISLYPKKYFCPKCGLISEVIGKEALDSFDKIKDYIIDLE